MNESRKCLSMGLTLLSSGYTFIYMNNTHETPFTNRPEVTVTRAASPVAGHVAFDVQVCGEHAGRVESTEHGFRVTAANGKTGHGFKTRDGAVAVAAVEWAAA